MSELHPLTPEVMAQLEFDHIEGYNYVLTDDLEVIVSHKLGRVRKNPAEDVTDIMNKLLLWEPPPDNEEKESCARKKFESVNGLIRDTVSYYRALDYKNSREEPVAE